MADFMPVLDTFQTPAIKDPKTGSSVRAVGGIELLESIKRVDARTLNFYVYSNTSVGRGVAATISIEQTRPGVALIDGPIRTGVTAGSAHIAQATWNTWGWDKQAFEYDVILAVKFWGESVDGKPAFVPGTTAGSKDFPLGVGRYTITIPAIGAPQSPRLGVKFSGTDSLTVNVDAVGDINDLTREYILQRRTGEDYQSEVRSATPYHYVQELARNTRYSWRPGAFGYDEREYFGAWTAWHYTTPTAPTKLSVRFNGTSNTLSWSTNAFMATSVQVQRQANGIWTTIYNGSPKTTHIDTPPGDAVGIVYRVRAIAPGGITDWSNIVTSGTVDLPSAPTNFRRTGTLDSNDFIFSWTNNEQLPNRPYSTIRILNVDTGNYKDHDGDITTLTQTYATGQTYRFQIRAQNAAGYSSYTPVVYMSSRTRTPVWSGLVASGSQFKATLNTLDSLRLGTNSTAVQYQFTPEGGSAGSWQSLGNMSGGFVSDIVWRSPQSGSVRFRAMTTTTGLPDGTKTSAYGTTPMLFTSVKPKVPSSIVLNGKLVTVKVPTDDTGTGVRTVRLYLNNTLVNTWNNIAGTEAPSLPFELPSLPSSRFTLKATIESPMWKGTVQRSVVIDLDKQSIMVGTVRYQAFIINDDGLGAIPCALQQLIK
jgi:hypothetical protein